MQALSAKSRLVCISWFELGQRWRAVWEHSFSVSSREGDALLRAPANGSGLVELVPASAADALISAIVTATAAQLKRRDMWFSSRAVRPLW